MTTATTASPAPPSTPCRPPARGLRRAGAAARLRLLRLGAAWLAAGMLGGCGGGLYIGYEDDHWDDGPPRVGISPLPSPIQGGGTLVLGAAATDADGVVRVEFWRLEPAGWLLLGSVSTPPAGSSTYQWSTVVPRDGRMSVSYFARAYDRTGRVGDSTVVSAAVFP